jgi:hypothetical protein
MKIVDVVGRELTPGDVLTLQEVKNHDFSLVAVESNRLSAAPGKLPTVRVHLRCDLIMEFPDQGQLGIGLPVYLIVKAEKPQGSA